MKCKVVIVGAGASGLQCANHLLTKYGLKLDDLIVLEARDRVGGRIWTTYEKRKRIRNGHSKARKNPDRPDDIKDDDADEIEFCLDHGAAWVHGTGLEWLTPIDGKVPSIPMENPMM